MSLLTAYQMSWLSNALGVDVAVPQKYPQCCQGHGMAWPVLADGMNCVTTVNSVQFNSSIQKTLIIPHGAILLWLWRARKIIIHKLREQYNKHNTTNKRVLL